MITRKAELSRSITCGDVFNGESCVCVYKKIEVRLW